MDNYTILWINESNFPFSALYVPSGYVQNLVIEDGKLLNTSKDTLTLYSSLNDHSRGTYVTAAPFQPAYFYTSVNNYNTVILDVNQYKWEYSARDLFSIASDPAIFLLVVLVAALLIFRVMRW